MTLDILITIFLVLLNGFFVAAEFAIVKVRTSQIEMRAREGERVASIAKSIIHHLDAYLSATQLGITLASLGLGWKGEEVAARIVLNAAAAMNLTVNPLTMHSIALTIAFVLITIMHIVFGELAPKSLAIQRPEGTTMALAVPLQIFYLIFRPFIWMLNKLANAALRMIGITPQSGHEVHSPQELLYILEQSATSGALQDTEHQILENVFDFYDRPARQIMVPRIHIIGVEVNEHSESVVGKIIEEGYTRMPVYDGNIDHIIGIIHSKDLLISHYNKTGVDIRTLMRPVYAVPETKKIGGLLRELQQKHMEMAVLIDEFGGTSGLITLEDILEELVGEIQDEYDNEKPWVEQTSADEFTVLGATAILDANENLPVPLPEGEDYETVGGYVNFLFGKIPEVGEHILSSDYEFTVISRVENRIDSVKLKVLRKPTAEIPAEQT